MENIYSTNKIIYHQEVLEDLKRDIPPSLIKVHLFPTNVCNHNCNFCLHKEPVCKNIQQFNKKDFIPWTTMSQLIKDLSISMHIKAIELSGGGEVLAYPHIKQLINTINKYEMEYSLISNGTLLTKEIAKQIAPKMSWARISLDSANAQTYSKIRGTPDTQFKKALKAIKLLRKYAKNKEFKLGAGFLVTPDNYTEIYDFCKLVKNFGVDNVRIGLAFLPDKLPSIVHFYSKKHIEKSKELEDDTFKIYGLLDERHTNINTTARPYSFCPTKEISCVIGANLKIYTCCSLVYMEKGEIGSIKNQSFPELWKSKEKMFREFDAKKTCTLPCMYDNRNIQINKLINDKPIHKNFI